MLCIDSQTWVFFPLAHDTNYKLDKASAKSGKKRKISNYFPTLLLLLMFLLVCLRFPNISSRSDFQQWRGDFCSMLRCRCCPLLTEWRTAIISPKLTAGREVIDIRHRFILNVFNSFFIYRTENVWFLTWRKPQWHNSDESSFFNNYFHLHLLHKDEIIKLFHPTSSFAAVVVLLFLKECIALLE